MPPKISRGRETPICELYSAGRFIKEKFYLSYNYGKLSICSGEKLLINKTIQYIEKQLTVIL